MATKYALNTQSIIAESLRALQFLIGVIIALALTTAVREVTLTWNRCIFTTFLSFIIPFYHGSVITLSRARASGGSIEVKTMDNFALLLAEAILFYFIAFNLGIWSAFLNWLMILLAIDVLRVLIYNAKYIARNLSNVIRKHKIIHIETDVPLIWGILNAFVLLFLRYLPTLQRITCLPSRCLLLGASIIRLGLDYALSWEHYFPSER